jgi:hypothetical protein
MNNEKDMPTWTEVRDHLRGRFTLAGDTGRAVILSFQVPGGGREVAQSVLVAPVETHGEPWLIILADLFSEASLPHRSALLYQDTLPFGAIVLRKEIYLFRHGIALERMAWEDLERAIRLCAHEAARLRLNVAPQGRGPGMFGMYED